MLLFSITNKVDMSNISCKLVLKQWVNMPTKINIYSVKK